MRCFLALDVPPPVCTHLSNVAHEALTAGRVKWVPPQQMHLTLVFAGDVDDDTVELLHDAIDQVDLAPMQFALDHLGCFPPRGEPRVLWAGLTGDLEELERLLAELLTYTDHAGIPRDDRPFTPHITLGRVKSPFGAYALIDQLAAAGDRLRKKPFAATALTLYRSDLSGQGPIYTPLLRRAIG
ncbi:MAG: RNA 2',3'-cyclic phosphodiesterase [Planctomycetota bacterium]